ncbi:MAG: NAD(P)H-dependent oxidoreductase subunit E [Gemmatimonadales bacterium]|jgi:NADH:ubiquinone oxidoreductase subunit F (NADH-binding)/NADH:ubiquinone oxidoreductase subunit E
MRLIRELERQQAERGHLDEACLRELSSRLGVPLYRLEGLVSFYPHFRTEPAPPVTISVCRDMSCHLAGGADEADALWGELASAERFSVEEASCLGCCELAPAARVNGHPCQLGDALELATSMPKDDPGLGGDQREWKSDPYGDDERYGVLRAALASPSPSDEAERIVDALQESGLRGMGGAGFPTGLKWRLVRDEEARPKYVVCNADESEPGTFKDRVIMEQLPHLVVEGIALGAFVVGAEKGIIYLRHEYGRAKAALEAELDRARAAGLLGSGILGTEFSLDIEIFVSPGGYILGEETALLEALEDRRGEPRNKPPFPGTVGLHGRPTLMNNVETLALVPGILRQGVAWWQSIGRDGHVGLKFISVSGHVEKPGVYEIPTGTTVAELIELAGGVSGGRALKAFAPGGASSNFLPARHVEVPIDFATIEERGSMMGSGALVVVAEDTPLLPLAANVVRFFRNESCGKCVPCRIGTQKATEMLEATLQSGVPLDWSVIRKLNLLLGETSICGLGYVALNPLISVAEHWPEEVPGCRADAPGQGQDKIP